MLDCPKFLKLSWSLLRLEVCPKTRMQAVSVRASSDSWSQILQTREGDSIESLILCKAEHPCDGQTRSNLLFAVHCVGVPGRPKISRYGMRLFGERHRFSHL